MIFKVENLLVSFIIGSRIKGIPTHKTKERLIIAEHWDLAQKIDKEVA